MPEAPVAAAAPRRALRADAERNRRLVLDAAAAVFAERGLEAGVAEIAQRAGVGTATVFRRFPTKQDLIVAVVDARICDMGDQLDAGAGRPRPVGRGRRPPSRPSPARRHATAGCSRRSAAR